MVIARSTPSRREAQPKFVAFLGEFCAVPAYLGQVRAGFLGASDSQRDIIRAGMAAVLVACHGRRRDRKSGAGTPVADTAFDPGRTIGISRTRPRMANKGGTRLNRLTGASHCECDSCGRAGTWTLLGFPFEKRTLERFYRQLGAAKHRETAHGKNATSLGIMRVSTIPPGVPACFAKP
jgi:hypothetical protein